MTVSYFDHLGSRYYTQSKSYQVPLENASQVSGFTLSLIRSSCSSRPNRHKGSTRGSLERDWSTQQGLDCSRRGSAGGLLQASTGALPGPQRTTKSFHSHKGPASPGRGFQRQVAFILFRARLAFAVFQVLFDRLDPRELMLALTDFMGYTAAVREVGGAGHWAG